MRTLLLLLFVVMLAAADVTVTPTTTSAHTLSETKTSTKTTSDIGTKTPAETLSETITMAPTNSISKTDTDTATLSGTITPEETLSKSSSKSVSLSGSDSAADTTSETITPPPTESGTRTQSQSVSEDSLSVSGGTPTKTISVTPAETRTQTASFWGKIDPVKSSVCCDGPFVAGQETICHVNAVAPDADGNLQPVGGAADECHMRVSTLTDGAGESLLPITDQANEPRWVSPGRFEFKFTATKSGCKGTAGVSYKGDIIGHMVAMFTIQPDAIDYDKATSECKVDSNGDVQCNVTQRDRFHNPVSHCDTLGNCVSGIAYTG